MKAAPRSQKFLLVLKDVEKIVQHDGGFFINDFVVGLLDSC